MNKGLESLQRAVGGIVKQVVVEVVYYGVEKAGTVGDVGIELTDGCRFFLGCAGDGSIHVMRPGKVKVGNAPGIATLTRTVASLEGRLSEIIPDGASLQLRIGERTLEVTNNDDEMAVVVDGSSLPVGVFMR